jgi:murein L,D-transpeptidase YafK
MPARPPARCREWLSGAWRREAIALLAALAIVTAWAPVRGQEMPLIDRVVVLKSQRVLELLQQGQVVKSYPINLGLSPVGPKRRQGDNRTPEGLYSIDRHQAESQYHLALHISYPSEADTARAQAQQVDPGGAVFIHGFPRGFEWADPALLRLDWTAGCIAVSDRAIEEIWRLVADGTAIEIRP